MLALACRTRSEEQDLQRSYGLDNAAQPGKRVILFVVVDLPGPGILGKDDVTIKTRLERQGYAVPCRPAMRVDTRGASDAGPTL